MIINRKPGPAGLYIHIPFCLKKCGYCDFLSFGGYGEEFRQRYADALVEEILLYRGAKIEVDTIFFGGGTPSLLSGDQIGRIMEAASAAFCVSEDAEVSLEANPGALSADKLKAFRKAGVGRLSIGAQSMNNALLRFLGRAHDRTAFLENYRSAREAGFDNINVDLMLGLPGQSCDVWQDSLQEILALAPEHLSFYSLQLEEGTPFARQYREGNLDLPPTEEDRRMYHQGIRMLKAAGYHHYEISNSAKPGYECRHNMKYWSFELYYGTGLGAHSFSYDWGRRCNTSDFDTYFQRIRSGRLPLDEKAYEPETMEELMGEYVFTALRKTEGLDLRDFYITFGKQFFEAYPDCRGVISQYEKDGYLTLNSAKLALTERGIDISNRIMAEFV